MEAFLGVLRRLRSVAEENATGFEADGFRSLFAMLRAELSEEYLETIKNHLKELKFRRGALLSAQLGDSDEGGHYMLQREGRRRRFPACRARSRWDSNLQVGER